MMIKVSIIVFPFWQQTFYLRGCSDTSTNVGLLERMYSASCDEFGDS